MRGQVKKDGEKGEMGTGEMGTNTLSVLMT